MKLKGKLKNFIFDIRFRLAYYLADKIGYKQYECRVRGLGAWVWAKDMKTAQAWLEHPDRLAGDDSAELLPNWIRKIRGW